MAENFVGRAKTDKASNIKIGNIFLDPDYEVSFDSESNIGDTGLLKLFELKPKDVTLPAFRARWDENKDVIDVDLIDNPELEKKFKSEQVGFMGHHPEKTSPNPRIFRIDIKIPNRNIYSANITFNIEKKAHLQTTTHATVSLNAITEKPWLSRLFKK